MNNLCRCCDHWIFAPEQVDHYYGYQGHCKEKERQKWHGMQSGDRLPRLTKVQREGPWLCAAYIPVPVDWHHAKG